ncbi:YheU family protein [Shewanella sp. Isolate11]|uniref:YheU family protein n=1 Tax=Shewanella sp. Isolate11 TaxID=2908530 RepID=UPI001EFDCAF1|nr:YheU family protein [Shewanella sp. Isolate11]MCG9697528.1 YheU family protein [Shewanella sp. Isolate11]
MLVPYEALQQLAAETLNNLIKEYLLTQMEDGSFATLDDKALSNAIAQCQRALARGELLVEYSEDDESIAIRHKDNTLTITP